MEVEGEGSNGGECCLGDIQRMNENALGKLCILGGTVVVEGVDGKQLRE